MATEPLFAPDRDHLVSRMRLSDVASSDTSVIIDQAIEEVRLGFYDRLGESRVDTINGTAYAENPSTSAQRLISRAIAVEISWTKLILLRRLPILFRDNASGSLVEWNEEAFIREGQAMKMLDREIQRLENEVKEGLIALAEGEADTSAINVLTIGPEESAPRPGKLVNSPWRRPYPNDNPYEQ